MKGKFGAPNESHRNFVLEAQRSEPVNSDIKVRPITEAELKKFEYFRPECKEGKRWTERY